MHTKENQNLKDFTYVQRQLHTYIRPEKTHTHIEREREIGKHECTVGHTQGHRLKGSHSEHR